MPDAKTHDLITFVSGAVLALPAYHLLASSQSHEAALNQTALLVGAHLLSGIMFSPDLDIDSAIDDRWGILFWIWRPYMWVVPHRHRWLSHGLVVSALLRLLYFYLVVVLLLIGGAWLLGQIGIVVPYLHVRLTDWLLGLARDHPREVRAFLIGFITGGAAHTIADWLVTGGRPYLRRLGIRVRRYDHHDEWRPRWMRFR